MRTETDKSLTLHLTDRERELNKQDEFVDVSNFARKSEFVKDEYFNLEQKDKSDPIFKAFKKMEVADKLGVAVFSKAYQEIEIGICPECKEWTDTEDPCCGVQPITDGRDYDDIER